MPRTIEDAEKAAEYARVWREIALKALEKVINAKTKVEAEGPNREAKFAKEQAVAWSVIALEAAAELRTVSARDHAERARYAAVAAEDASNEAEKVYGKLTDPAAPVAAPVAAPAVPAAPVAAPGVAPAVPAAPVVAPVASNTSRRARGRGGEKRKR